MPGIAARFTKSPAIGASAPIADPPIVTTVERARRSYQVSDITLLTMTTLPRSSAIAAGVERWP